MRDHDTRLRIAVRDGVLPLFRVGWHRGDGYVRLMLSLEAAGTPIAVRGSRCLGESNLDKPRNLDWSPGPCHSQLGSH